MLFSMGHEPFPKDSLYPMRVVTRLTGLTAHTVRVWERRYGAVAPHRTAGNSRRYSAKEVHRLTLLRDATQIGYRIKEIAKLTEVAIEGLLGRQAPGLPGAATLSAPTLSGVQGLDRVRADYLEAITSLDARSASDILSRAALILEPTSFLFEVVLPILRSTGDLWKTGTLSVAHEHLVTFQVRGHLDTLLRLSSPLPGAPRILVATPGGCWHEFGALVGALLAAARGFEPVYLGPSVPVEDLLRAVERSRASLLLLAVLQPRSQADQEALNRDLLRLAEQVEVWLGLPPDHPGEGDLKEVRYFHRFDDLDLALTRRVSSTVGKAR